MRVRVCVLECSEGFSSRDKVGRGRGVLPPALKSCCEASKKKHLCLAQNVIASGALSHTRSESDLWILGGGAQEKCIQRKGGTKVSGRQEGLARLIQ